MSSKPSDRRQKSGVARQCGPRSDEYTFSFYKKIFRCAIPFENFLPTDGSGKKISLRPGFLLFEYKKSLSLLGEA